MKAKEFNILLHEYINATPCSSGEMIEAYDNSFKIVVDNGITKVDYHTNYFEAWQELVMLFKDCPMTEWNELWKMNNAPENCDLGTFLIYLFKQKRRKLLNLKANEQN